MWLWELPASQEDSMTVANNYAPVVAAADGSTTVFSGSWNALSAAYLLVQLLNTTTGAYTTVAQGVGANQYQVTSLTSSGFVITFNTAPLSGNNVVISRDTTQQQTIPYTTSRGFQGSVEESSFDALTNMVQELNDNIGNSIQAPVGDSAANLILPIASLRAGYVLAFDAEGDVIVSTSTLAQIESGFGPPGPAGPTGPAGTVVPWGVAGGTADALTVTMTPAVTSLTDGLLVSFRSVSANATTTPTLKANATTAHVITAKGGAALSPGNIAGSGAEYLAVYNLANTRFELLNPTNATASAGAMTLLSSQTISSSTATISDTTHITSAYSHYIWEISNLNSVTNGVDAFITVQQGGVFLSNGYYSSCLVLDGSSSTHQDNTAAQINVTGAKAGILNSGHPSVIVFEFWNPIAAHELAFLFRTLQGDGNYVGPSTFGGGTVNNPATTTGIKLSLSSGNIATCQANLYGIV